MKAVLVPVLVFGTRAGARRRFRRLVRDVHDVEHQHQHDSGPRGPAPAPVPLTRTGTSTAVVVHFQAFPCTSVFTSALNATEILSPRTSCTSPIPNTGCWSTSSVLYRSLAE